MGEAKGLMITGLTLMTESGGSEAWETGEWSPGSVASNSVYLPAEMVDILIRDEVLTGGIFAGGHGLKVSPGINDVPIRWRFLFC